MIRSRPHLVAALLLATAVQACSQFGGMGGGTRYGGGGRRSGQDGNEQRSNEAARLSVNDQIRLRLTEVRIALNLTPEQAAPWQAYDDKVVEMLSDSGRDAGAAAGGNALNQIDRVSPRNKGALPQWNSFPMPPRSFIRHSLTSKNVSPIACWQARFRRNRSLWQHLLGAVGRK